MNPRIPMMQGLARAALRTRVSHPLRVQQASSAANLDWGTLGFSFVQTNSMVKYGWKDGGWDKGVLTTDFNLSLHSTSNAFHYGQAIFEGLKVFRGPDGAIRAFNSKANAARLRTGCLRFQMPEVPQEMFDEAIDRVVLDNTDFVPPYGHGAAMYLRPFLFGHGQQLGLGPAPEYTFGVVGCPVGAYYKGGLQAVDAVVVDDYDRAAPRGVGNIKCAGNYAADLKPSMAAKQQGFPICLYMDAKTNQYVEEFSTSNFIGITKDGTIVTPASSSILPSCTKGVLMQLAQDMGMKVEERPVAWEEVGELKEVAACGTAVVLTPISSITRGDEVVRFSGFDTISKLYNLITSIQLGEAEDKLGYTRVVGN